MGRVLVLLLVVSGALAEVAESTDGATLAPPPTVGQREDSPGDPKMMVVQPTSDEGAAEASRLEPINSVCMMRVNCAGDSSANYEEPQRDEEFQQDQTTAEATSTKTVSSRKPKRRRRKCSIDIQRTVTYAGSCVRLDQQTGACRAGWYMTPFHERCHPPPQD